MSVSFNSTRVGDFELLDKLGEGAMGAVYKARQVSLDRIVALKILPRRFYTDRQFVDRFLREARATAKLNHPNIVAGIDVGSADGYHYFAMEFIDGVSLGTRLKRSGALAEREVARIGSATAAALAHAHDAGIVHRDVKPDNILLDRDGTPKLADLGLAKAGTETDSTLTQAGTTVGTPHYIAPEQASGKLDADGRADIYSLGCTLYHAATGKTPFSAPTPAVMMVKHLKDKMPHPKSIRANLSDGFCSVLERMVARDPRNRYPDMKSVERDLGLVAAGSPPRNAGLDPDKSNFLPDPQDEVEIEPERISRTGVSVNRRYDRLRRSARRSTMLPTIAALGAFALIGTAGWLFHMEAELKRQNDATMTDGAKTDPHHPPQKAVDDPSMPAPHTEGDFYATKRDPAPPSGNGPDTPRQPAIKPVGRSAAVPLISGDSTDPWRVRAPNWTVKNGVLNGHGTDANAVLDRQQCLPPDFELSFDATCGQSFHFGWTSDSLTNFVIKNGAHMQLTTYRNNDNDELAHFDLKNHTESHAYRIEVKNTSIRVYIDNALCMSSDRGEPSNGLKRSLTFYASRMGPLTVQGMAVRELQQISNPPPATQVSTQASSSSGPTPIPAPPPRPATPGPDDLDHVIAKLKELNPSFDGNVQSKLEGDRVVELCFSADTISDISPLRSLGALRQLKCASYTRKSSITDISCLRGFPLSTLDLTGSKVTDLSPLRGMQLKKLMLCQTAVSNLAPLKGLPLEWLEIAGTQVTDLSPLQDMPLKTLNISTTKVADILALKNCPLTTFNCGWTPVRDLSPLADNSTLKELSIMGSKPIDISTLRKCSLKRIHLEYKSDLHSKLLREMKSLTIINGKSAVEFFNENP